MGRRIEVELTSTKEDGSWTWRAAGAKQPRGELSGDLLYGGAKIGDVVKVEADFHLDGIEIVEVFPPKAKKERTDLLELKTRPLRDDELVTTQRVSRRDRGDRSRRGDRPRRSDRGERRDRRGGSGRREARPDRPQRPKPKRLRAKRDHRDALLASVAEEHRPIVEQVVRDGMPGVRAAIEKQNADAREAGKPEIDAAPILAIAERNLAAARLAEWRDRADAALATVDDLDIRDLRSVVVVGNDVARDDESRALAEQLKAALDQRMETDHNQWLSDLRNAVSDGRVVRALRLSSRPVKAGAPLPTELAGELSKQAAAALAADVDQPRWAIVLDALAFSPVRGAVTPAGLPPEPGEELLNEVRRLSDRIPAIAALFGIDPAQVPRRAKRRRPGKGAAGGQGRKPKQGKDADRPKARQPKRDKPGAEAGDAKPASKPASEAADPSPTPQEPEAVAVPETVVAQEPAAEPEVTAVPEAAVPEAAAPLEPTEAAAPEAPASPEPAAEPEAAAPLAPTEAAEPEVTAPEAAVEPEAAAPEVAAPLEPTEAAEPEAVAGPDVADELEPEPDSTPGEPEAQAPLEAESAAAPGDPIEPGGASEEE